MYKKDVICIRCIRRVYISILVICYFVSVYGYHFPFLSGGFSAWVCISHVENLQLFLVNSSWSILLHTYTHRHTPTHTDTHRHTQTHIKEIIIFYISE